MVGFVLGPKVKDRQEHAQRYPRSCRNIVFTVHAGQVDFATLLCFETTLKTRYI